jgi:hypothetical protein
MSGLCQGRSHNSSVVELCLKAPPMTAKLRGPMAICKPLSSRYRPGRQRYLKINSRIQAQAGELKASNRRPLA